jgi:LysM repeat protein
MSFRRMLPFILINIVVSAVVMLGILYVWETRRGESEPVVVVATATPQPTGQPGGVGQAPAGDATAPAEEESDGPITYQVQAGDTLGSISQEYDVPMDDIMAANGIDNPNVLSVGQTLIIPIGGLVTPEPEVTPTLPPDQAPTPIPTEAIVTGEVDVQITGVVGVGILTEEAVTIANLGNRPVALLDWKLLGPQGREYTFEQITLFGDGAAVTVHTETGVDTINDLYWGLEDAIWQPGQTITLIDAEGSTQATFVVP